jgi:hypothetical protein
MPEIDIDHHIKMLDKRALGDAYVMYVRDLFAVWLRDKTGQPERMMRGAEQARQAYVAAFKAIEER